MRVMVVMGTRPEVIKLAPVVAALRREVETIVCATGQHREMLAQALAFFDIAPDVSLDVMKPGQTLNSLASRLLAGLDDVIEQVLPDWVLVQGDTTTAFCAGLAAFHRGVKVGHVEAGLRTHDLVSPFPEEANRSLLSRISTVNFVPTQLARQHLLDEGILAQNIFVTGNSVVDSINAVRSGWVTSPPVSPLPQWDEDAQPRVLVTCHRRENLGDVLRGICNVLRNLCGKYSDYRWIFPVHLNPSVRAMVLQELDGIANLALIDPVDYPTSLYLISRSTLILSDSGGIQEEAPSFGVPVVVMRSHTERREGVDAGFATLAGQTAESIEDAVTAWLDDPTRRELLRGCPNPYGDGQTSRRIVNHLLGRPVEGFHG